VAKMATDASAAIPNLSDGQGAGCPFDPPPELRARAPLPGSGCGRQHTVAGHRIRGCARAADGPADQFRHHAFGLSARQSRRAGPPDTGPDVHQHGRPRPRAAAPHGDRHVRGSSASRRCADCPGDRGRVDRRDAGRAAARRPGPGIRASGALAHHLRLLGVPYADHDFFQRRSR